MKLFPIFTLAIICLTACTRKTSVREYRVNGFAQGTTYSLLYYSGSDTVSRAQIDSLFAVIDSSMSLYKKNSLISRFNLADSSVQIDEHMRVVVEKGMAISRVTDGYFDITVYPLVKAWGFGPEKPEKMPDSSDIQNILPCIGVHNLQLEGDILHKKKPCVQIDLNGIAQGYSADLIADFLEERQISNYLVEIGGEMRVSGKKYPDGRPMQIGIESPADSTYDELIIRQVIEPGNAAVTSSGNFQKYYLSGRKLISHLIDPHSGYPLTNELISVTVIAREAIEADGYDNALMGMGLNRAFDFLSHHPELNAYFIYRKPDGNIADTMTAGFRKLIRRIPAP